MTAVMVLVIMAICVAVGYFGGWVWDEWKKNRDR